MDNFDLKKYLVENKVTTNSKMITEEISTEYKFKVGDRLETYGGQEDVTVVDMKPNLTTALKDTKNPEAVEFLKQAVQQSLISTRDASKPFYLVTSEYYPEDIYYVESELTRLTGERSTDTQMMDEASYISPEGDLHIEDGENTELGYAIENALDSWPLSDIEMGPDVFVEGLLDYFADFDPTFRQPAGMLKGDTLENEVIATAKAYKEGTINLKAAVSQFRKTLSNRNYYTGRG